MWQISKNAAITPRSFSPGLLSLQQMAVWIRGGRLLLSGDERAKAVRPCWSSHFIFKVKAESVVVCSLSFLRIAVICIQTFFSRHFDTFPPFFCRFSQNVTESSLPGRYHILSQSRIVFTNSDSNTALRTDWRREDFECSVCFIVSSLFVVVC